MGFKWISNKFQMGYMYRDIAAQKIESIRSCGLSFGIKTFDIGWLRKNNLHDLRSINFSMGYIPEIGPNTLCGHTSFNLWWRLYPGYVSEYGPDIMDMDIVIFLNRQSYTFTSILFFILHQDPWSFFCVHLCLCAYCIFLYTYMCLINKISEVYFTAALTLLHLIHLRQ